ncbi:MAG: Fur family transcriptional regulator [Henriciella sp.]|nr:Fur family transcriptional regulator [Henriciella sp.]
MNRLRKTSPASGQRRLHRRRWRNPGQPKPTTADLIQAASEEAQLEGKSLTHIRKHVLQVLLNAARPLTAYEVLDALEGVGSSSPPTAYRALDFLTELGFVKRIESLNAYLALEQGPSDAPIALFICDTCGQAKEISTVGVAEALAGAAITEGVSVRQVSVEIRGSCQGELGCPSAQPRIASGADTPDSAPVDQHSHK